MHDEIFKCDRLNCKLSREACSERFVRADSLQLKESGGWEPAGWARFAACRECPVGRAHASSGGAVAPGKAPVDSPHRPVRLPAAENGGRVVLGTEGRTGPSFIQTDGGVYVRQDLILAGPFKDEAKARRWLSTRKPRSLSR